MKSFSYAFQGILYVIKTELNMKIHLVIGSVVLMASYYFQISKIEWLIVILTICGMLILEVINTAIERTVDLITNDIHPIAKIAKDAAAGAVLIFAIVSIIIGVFIFLPYIKSLFLQ